MLCRQQESMEKHESELSELDSCVLLRVSKLDYTNFYKREIYHTIIFFCFEDKLCECTVERR